MEVFKINRGKPGILYEGFRFRKDRDSKTVHLWRCVKKTCKAICRTDLEDTLILGGRFDHDHVEEDDRTIERQALRQTCKQKAVAEPSERPNKLIIAEVQKNSSSEMLPQDVRAVRQAVYRERRKTQPKLPKTRAETIEILETYEFNSSHDEPMIHIADAESEIVMFSTESNLRLMSQDVHLFGDGTFQFCPKFFTSYILFMHTRMDSIYHVYFSCCHQRQSSATNTCFVT